MHHDRLHEGDRVVTYNPRFNPAGAMGTVVMVYRLAHDCYDVLLDGATRPCLMFGEDLERAPLRERSIGMGYN